MTEEVPVEPLKLKKKDKLKASTSLRKDHGVYYIRIPKKLVRLIPEVLNWEIEVKPHSSGYILLSELVLRPKREQK